MKLDSRNEVKMTKSKQIASLLGPTLIAIGISEAMNLRILTNPPDPVGLVYLNGGLLFVAGLAILRVHNLWVRDWPVLVTLTGWLFTLGGLARMFTPESTQSGDTWVYVMCIVLSLVGIVLTFKAYSEQARVLLYRFRKGHQ